jgi:hypothetical protein
MSINSSSLKQFYSRLRKYINLSKFHNSSRYYLLTNRNVTHFIFISLISSLPKFQLTICNSLGIVVVVAYLFFFYIYIYLKTVQDVTTCHSAGNSIFYNVIIFIDGNEAGMSYCLIMYSNIAKIKARTI